VLALITTHLSILVVISKNFAPIYHTGISSPILVQQHWDTIATQVFSGKDLIDKVLASPDGISKCRILFKGEHQMNAKKIRKRKLIKLATEDNDMLIENVK